VNASVSPYNRQAEDIGNIVALEHVNVFVPDQYLATIFYVEGMGFTRDPYLMVDVSNMWINIGQSQFHMPSGPPQVLRGHVGLVLPDRQALLGRLHGVKDSLAGTDFGFADCGGFVEVTSPWGNRLRCFEPHPDFGRVSLGMAYVEFEVPVGTAAGIAAFYRTVLDTRADVSPGASGPVAVCSVGNHQSFRFRETTETLPPYDGHHVQIYLANFSEPHRKLHELGLVTEESDQWQYRFKDIVDPDRGAVLFTIEHEVRSMTHPLYARPLVNRDPRQTNRSFAPGHEEWRWHNALSS
jgi:hypothetical protein